MQCYFPKPMTVIRKTHSEILCVKYTDERKSLAIGFSDGSINLYNTKTYEREITLADEDTKDINNAVTIITNQQNVVKNTLTCTYSGGVIKKWNYLTGQCIFTIKENRQTCGIAYHPKLPKLFCYGDDGKIILYDEETQKMEGIYQPSEKPVIDGHLTKILALIFNPSCNNEFISGGWDSMVHFWDIRRPTATRHISDVFMGGEGLSINKAGTQLITTEWKKDNPIKLWNYGTGELIQIIKPDVYTSQLYCSKYIHKDYIATGGSAMNLLRIINLTSYTTVFSIRELPSGVYSLDFHRPKRIQKPDEHFDLDLPNVIFNSGKTVYEVKFR